MSYDSFSAESLTVQNPEIAGKLVLKAEIRLI